MAIDYDPFKPQVGTSSYITRIDDLITNLEIDINALITKSDANEAWITALPNTGLKFNDGISLTLGTGNDATISYNGINNEIEISAISTEFDGNVHLLDNKFLFFGNTDDSNIYWDNATSNLNINSNSAVDINAATTMLLEATTSISLIGNTDITGTLDVSSTIMGDLTGDVTGNADTATNAANAALLDNLDSTQFLRSDIADTKTAGDLTFSDNIAINIGTGNDLVLLHNSTNSTITNNTGTLNITSTAGTIFSGPVSGIDRRLIDVQIFTASGTWTKPTGCNAVEVWCVGGGGGGGAAQASGLYTKTASVGSGATGAAVVYSYLITGIGASETITVGAAGVGSSNPSVPNGTDGGTSSFGTLCVAVGGRKGNDQVGANNRYYVASGSTVLTGNTGQVIIEGGHGETGTATTANTVDSANDMHLIITGKGGDAGFGFGLGGGGFGADDFIDGGSLYLGSGGNATGYGAGGGGGATCGATTGISNGGNGSPGIIIVKSYT